MTAQSHFMQVMTERGYIHQATDADALDKRMTEQSIPAYIGFDCTADSLHVGSLVQIMMLRHLQKTGHKPIVLMGGGTTKIGDPSGKDSQRPLLSDPEIEKNKDGIRKIFEKYLTFGDRPTDALMVDNAEWLDALAYIAFLRDYGMHFSINRMLAMESVKIRLDRQQPMSFLEFNYSILQAYDFMELRRRYGCLLQMGGSDQWGNIITGVDLTRRADRQDVFGLTSPLITTASGAKMGKSAQGAIWLNKDKLPVWDFWQFWRNTEDADIGRFLRLFTELPLDEITRLEKLQGQDINQAKIILANEATALCHSRDEALKAAQTAQKTFTQSGTAENLGPGLGPGLGEGLPEITIAKTDIDKAKIDALAALKITGLATSTGEARRLIKGGGARLNDSPITIETRTLTADDFNADGKAKLSAGKKRHVLLSLK